MDIIPFHSIDISIYHPLKTDKRVHYTQVTDERVAEPENSSYS